jgi:hypothetical protein
MKIVRETNPNIVKELKPFLITDGGCSIEDVSKEIYEAMSRYDDNICVMVSYNQKIIEGFIIGFVVPNRSYIWIGGLYSRLNNTDSEEIFDEFISWCREKNATEVRGETARNSVVSRGMRNYGFSEFSITMRKSI